MKKIVLCLSLIFSSSMASAFLAKSRCPDPEKQSPSKGEKSLFLHDVLTNYKIDIEDINSIAIKRDSYKQRYAGRSAKCLEGIITTSMTMAVDLILEDDQRCSFKVDVSRMQISLNYGGQNPKASFRNIKMEPENCLKVTNKK